ncbi:MAG: starch-binding protein, partial [Oscillospiraceae bacterium]|nr:starch-binding protein [Oscillospiraceae bacterium]
SQGIPFIYSGDEMLREKKDEWGTRYDNAFGTSDYVNKIRWSDLQSKEFAQRTDDYYAGLIAFRKNHQALRCTNGSDAWNATTIHSINGNTMLVYVDGNYNYECSDGIVMIFNGSDQTQWVDVQNYVPHGYYQATIHGTQAGNTPLWGKDINGYSDAVGVEPYSVTVLVKGDLVHEESVYNQNMALVYCSHGYHTTSGLCTNCGVSVSHSYSGGKCSVCGLSQSAPDTYTVYYDNTTTNWGNVNVYAWAEAAGRTTEFTDSWPGTAMTHMGDGIYAIELPIEATNLIFNDGYGSQSINLGAPAYDATATMYDPATGSWVTYEESCKHESHSTDGLCSKCGLPVSHSWVEGICSVCGGTCEHTWASGTCYSCGMVCGHEHHGTDAACLLCGVKVEHTYTSAGTCSGCGLECRHTWNGAVCTNCGYTCAHAQHTTSGLCTKCGSDVEHAYTDGKCDICGLSEDAPDTVTIYYDNAGTQWEQVYVYAWAEAAGRTVMYTDGWPGNAMEPVEGDIYAITLPRDAAIVIFNNGEGGQTGDLSVPAYDSGLDLYRSATGLWATYGVACEHDYRSEVTAPTCTEPGYTTYTCALCGDSYVSDETEATGHSFVDGKCEHCGEADPDHCAHEYESEVTAPTCTEPGYTTYTCALCGDSYVSDETEATGHSFADGKCEHCGTVDPSVCTHEYESEVTAPTCTEPGYTTHTCTLCGHSFTDTETEPAGHSYVDGFCEHCGAEEPEGCAHEYEDVITEPTCTEAGFTTHTCTLCGESYTDTEVKALGHSYVDGVCERCGEHDYDSCEHQFVTTTVSPTCDTEGYTANTCELCGYVEKSDIVEAKGHSFSNGMCTVCGKPKPLSTDYYLIGYINGANYGCEEDGENMGIYKFENNMLKATFQSTSYVFVKTAGNAKWYMCDGYPGDGVNSANLYDTSMPIQHDKVNVPGAVEITFTLIERDDGSLTLTYVKAGECAHTYYSYVSQEPGCTTKGVMTYRCSLCADTYTKSIAAKGHNYVGANCTNCGAESPYYTATYYLFGYINGSNYACEEDGSNIGKYKFTNGKLVATFDTTSYVAVKTGDNAKWYMTNGYPGDDATSVKLYDTSTGIDANKMRVPGGVQITFTLRENADGSLTLSYVAAACSHSWDDGYVSTPAGCTTTGVRTRTCTKCGESKDETIAATGHNYVDGACAGCGHITDDYVEEFYLFGWINGGNYACEENYADMGEFKFVDGLLTATFREDSYIGIKTSGNLKWYMTQSYVGEGDTATFYDTATGAGEKMFVPGGVELTFTLTKNADGSLTLRYTTGSACEHVFGEGKVQTEPTCAEEGVMHYTCDLCGHVKAEPIPVIAHRFTGGVCVACGYECVHAYDMVKHDASCSVYESYEFTCGICGDCQIFSAGDMMDWSETKPGLMPEALFETKVQYRYRDWETIVSFVPGLEGYELTDSRWVNETAGQILYVKDWPTGFDKTNALYARYDNEGNKVTASETETDRVVLGSDEIVGYLYYHWCCAGHADSAAVESGNYDRFHAYYSTVSPDKADQYDASNGSYRFDDSTACGDSVRYFCVPVYGQSYTTAQKEFTYGRWTEWTGWSESVAEATETRQVETRTLYRLPDVALAEHDYESVVTAPTCTEAGYTTHTCTACGHSYTGAAVPATGHSYVDGTCEKCGQADPSIVTDPGLTLNYPTLSFEDEIIYNVYFSVKDMTSVVELGLMVLPKMDQNATIADAVALVPGYVTNGVVYLAKSEGIPAANMGDTLYFKVYAKLSDGSYAYSTAGGYNAKAYANSILKGENSAEMKALVVSMLNYGAEA